MLLTTKRLEPNGCIEMANRFYLQIMVNSDKFHHFIWNKGKILIPMMAFSWFLHWCEKGPFIHFQVIIGTFEVEVHNTLMWRGKIEVNTIT